MNLSFAAILLSPTLVASITNAKRLRSENEKPFPSEPWSDLPGNNSSVVAGTKSKPWGDDHPSNTTLRGNKSPAVKNKQVNSSEDFRVSQNGKIRSIVKLKPGTKDTLMKGLKDDADVQSYVLEEADIAILSFPANALNGLKNNPNILAIYPSSKIDLLNVDDEDHGRRLEPGTCADTPSWTDIDDWPCNLYEKYEEWGCPKWGHGYDGGKGVANDHCCHCKRSTRSIIFISDIEADYRGHQLEFVDNLVKYIKHIGDQNIKFDDGSQVLPDLVIHGGDVSDIKSAFSYNSDYPFGQLYNGGIPVISLLGNHDGVEDPSVKGTACYNKLPVSGGIHIPTKEANEFCKRTFEKSTGLTSQRYNFKFTEFPPDKNGHPSFFVAKFGGIQIASVNDVLVDDSGNQWAEFKKAVTADTSPTIFVSHRPLSPNLDNAWDVYCREEGMIPMKDFITGLNHAEAHFAGHAHQSWTKRDYFGIGKHEYVAPYPWINVGFPSSKQPNPPGFYAIEVGSKGIIEVKLVNYDVETVTGCYGAGKLIAAHDHWWCCHYDEWEYWESKLWTACGIEPCWGDGAICGAGTTCTSCCNGYEYWESKAFTACGIEPCWGDGAICGAGTTCTSCCNGSEYWESKASVACGTEPCWGDGALCGAGTCTSCCNGSEYWESKAFTACGTEPCWGGGALCGAGTTCTSCCNGYEWWWSRFPIGYYCK